MAIDDNTLYGVKGSQVKDFTAKIKNSVGGADKLAHLVYMVPLTINEGNEIAAQIDNPDVFGVAVVQTCVYGFLRAKDGVWLDRLGVGSAISNDYNFVFVNNDVSSNDAATIVKYTANWDDDEKDCYPTFVLCGQTAKTPFGNSRYTRIDLGANSQPGLSAWYHPAETSWAREPDYVIQRMTSTEATEIANQINAEQGSTVVSGIEVRSAMIFTIRNTTTGKILKYSAVKNMLQRGGKIAFLPDMARGSNYEIMSRAYGSSSRQSFILRDFHDDTEYEYILKNPSTESSNRQYMWYLFDHEDLREGLIDVFGIDDGASVASAPESLFQVAHDSSDNLYMAAGTSSASDWKQINNSGDSSYSTSEVKTSGTWIDGKSIYKKTVDTGALPNSAEKNTPHNISNLYRVIKLEGYAYRPTDGKTVPLPFAGSAGGATTVDVSVVSGNIRFLNAADMTAFTESNVTLYYTKTTD